MNHPQTHTEPFSQPKHSDVVRQLAKKGEIILSELGPEDCHLMHMVIGISGEAGELLDAIKKAVIYRKALDRNNIIEELGDLEFYLEGLRQGLGITREQTIEHNIHKLATGPNARYKGGYSDYAAQVRADKL